jgi:branched-chain amino acid transport system permease protein
VLGVFLVLLAAAPLVLPEFYVTLLNYVGCRRWWPSGWCC